MESHILYIFSAAFAVALGSMIAAVVKIFNMTEKARKHDREIQQRQWSQFLETLKDTMRITVESTNANMTVASALESINQIMQNHFRGDDNADD